MVQQLFLIGIFTLTCFHAQAVEPTPAPPPNFYTMPYGTPISLELAQKVTVAAIAEARKNNWLMSITIVDGNGNLVSFARMDNNMTGSINVSQNKARSAAKFKRATKVFEDALAEGGRNLRIFSLEGAVPSEGGIPIVLDGKIIGGIGVSGDAGSNDAIVARAGLEALKQ